MDQELEAGKLSGNKTKSKKTKQQKNHQTNTPNKQKQQQKNSNENLEQHKYILAEEPKHITVSRETCANGQSIQSKICKVTNIFKAKGQIKCNC